MEKLNNKETSDIQSYLASFNKEIECEELNSKNENDPESDESMKDVYSCTSGEELDDENPIDINIKSEDEDEKFYSNNYVNYEKRSRNYTKIKDIHLKSHEGEKCFKCDLCNYASISPRHLETHMFVHTDQKPFHCDECDQSFRQKQLLKRHKNIYHDPNYVRPEPKEKPHVCVLCCKAFRHRGNLIRHFALHDPEATAVEKAAAMRLGKPKNPGEDQDGEEDDYLKNSDKQDKQVIVFEVIQLPPTNSSSLDNQSVTMVDENMLLLNSGETENYSIIEQSNEEVNNFLAFNENISDPENIENISSISSGIANNVTIGFRKRLHYNSRKKQKTFERNQIRTWTKNSHKSSRILKVLARKEKHINEQDVVQDIPDEVAILQRGKELEHINQLQEQEDFKECFGFDDKNDDDDDDDILSISSPDYETFHSSWNQNIS